MEMHLISIVFCMLLIFIGMPVIGTEDNDLKTACELEAGWQYLPSYPNYCPSGIPDFSQLQNIWMSIFDGGNGIAESIASGDDVQVAAYGSPVYPDPLAPIVAPGPNCNLESTPGGDDLGLWMFCAPTSIANCFWWCDSIFSDPEGSPGDGEDNFSLVADYGAGDDHSVANVKLLICKLANAVNATTKGYVYYDDFKYGINQWFIDVGLDDEFDRAFLEYPTFDYVIDDFEQNHFVILILGFYNQVDDEMVLMGEHCTSIAGINLDTMQIAISDPQFDIENPGGYNHNDAQYVSYDIYDVVIGSPSSEIDCEWWLPQYLEGMYNYSVVTAVQVISPPPIPDLNCSGTLSWADVTPGDTVTGSFTVKNSGEPGSELDWEVLEVPNWGINWVFNPDNGSGLTPEDGAVIVSVSVEAPEEEETEFEGEIIILNSANPTDSCSISVSLITPFSYNQPTLLMQLLRLLFARFPFIASIFG